MFESVGSFEMYITKDFDLAGLKTIENITLNDTATNIPTQVNVITSWTGKFQVDKAPADGIFSVK